MERDLEVYDARNIEFQRVHHIRAKKQGTSRPIIACFLHFPDREKVFRRALELKNDIDVKVYADHPKEIQQMRRKLWPRLKRAREDGKRAFFDKSLISCSLMDISYLRFLFSISKVLYFRIPILLITKFASFFFPRLK